MKKAVLILLTFIAILPTVNAQYKEEIPCYTDEMLLKKITENPELLKRQHNHEEALLNKLSSANKRSSSGCDVRIIPTVFHIIHNNGSENISDVLVQEYVDKVNDVWRFRNIDIEDVDTQWHSVVTDMQVELRLAKYDENGKPTNGIVRVQSLLTNSAGDAVKSLSQWDPERYLNIYIVKTIANSGQGTILGYAYFPWMEQRLDDSTTSAGILIRSDVINRQTLPHELGHYLDLYHPFQSSCGTDCRTTGDKVCDTPPVYAASRGCNKSQNTCHQDVPNLRDMIENIMDYSDCRNILTKGQKARVDNTFEVYRSKLISIENLYLTGALDSNETFGAPVAAFETNIQEICEGSEVEFSDISCTNKDSTDYKWFFPSGTPSAAYVANPKVTYNKSGKYGVTLIIKNPNGSDTLVYNEYISVTPKEATLKAPLSEGFEDDGFPYEGWTVRGADADIAWKRSTDFSYSGDACLRIDNFGSGKLGEQYIFRTPPLDLRESESYELNFDLAYARIYSVGAERLEVFAIDACREVNLLRYAGSASSMRTVDEDRTVAFEPTASEWKNFKVDMSIAKSLSAATIEFRFTSHGEQNIYIDNLNIGTWSTGIGNKLGKTTLDIYPNPASNELKILGLIKNEKFIAEIFDLSGRSVFQSISVDHNSPIIDVSELEKGFYSIIIQSQNQIFSTQFIKE